MNEVQKKAKDILKCFVDICNELEIKYYLVCGTALGAVKYEGFIPWDDDIDVGLLRPDYDRFLKEAPALLPKHCILLPVPAAGQPYTRHSPKPVRCPCKGYEYMCPWSNAPANEPHLLPYPAMSVHES